MRRYKNSSLIKSLTFSLFILSIIYILSVVNFQYYIDVNKNIEKKESNYNNFRILLNELSSTATELDQLYNLFIQTGNEDILADYYKILDIYNGKCDTEHYFIYENPLCTTYETIVLKTIEALDSQYKDDMKGILFQFDRIISEHQDALSVYKEEISVVRDMSYSRPSMFSEEYSEDSLLLLFSKINDLEYLLKLSHTETMEQLNQKVIFHKIGIYALNSIIILYGIYIILRIYYLLIIPIKDGHKLVSEISKGNSDIRFKYKYNNEYGALINSFNNYLDLSQKNYDIINEQYKKIKLFSDIGEINYFEYDVVNKTIKIFYSKRFIEKYCIDQDVQIYSTDEYFSMMHMDDVGTVKKNVANEKEFKIEFRIKFPNHDNYCFISSIGYISEEVDNLFIGVQIDITELKIAQNLLLDQEKQYRLILDNSTDLIAKISPKGEFLFVSKAYRELFNYDESKYVQEYDKYVKINNIDWLEKVLKPPYSTKEKIFIETTNGEKWISWNNDAIFNDRNEIEYIITVGHEITELQNMNERLKFESEHDLLTGLLNRRGLFNKIEQLKDVNNLAAFFIDINNFKNINDFYGHEVGDMIIVKVAEELRFYEKQQCIIGRLSGDEFIVLVPNFEFISSLNFLKNKLLKDMHRNYRINNNDIFISASIGYAIYPEDTNDISKIISYADIAMYEAKMSHHKNCLRFTKEMYVEVNKKVEMASDLKKAIDVDEFEIYFQTIINIKNDEVAFMESLVRWHSQKGIIMPGAFLPIAEESGFMQSLDLLIIKKALSQFFKLRKQSPYLQTKLSLNVSPIMLLKKDFPHRLNNLVRLQKLNNEDICVEISENTFVHNIEECSVQIKKLRQLGFLVALDDFGREFSSLSILDRVEFDIIKIDQLFIKNLKYDTNIEIINMVIKIAQLKNKLVIVEGVETLEQKEILISLGCEIMQGFYFSKPRNLLKEVV